jgi:C4-dicarboxylate-specific signal transduction histidine kinase
LQDAQLAAMRASDLTAQMLAYAGKGRFVVQPLDLNQMIAETAHLLMAVISKKARLHTEFAADLPATLADATQIRQVVMNLITNASDALGDQPGTISLRTGVVDADSTMLAAMYGDERLAPGRYVLLCVSDTGCGFDAETQARLFDPFFTTKFTGRGLGLAAVLGILRGHHGAIAVEGRRSRGRASRCCCRRPRPRRRPSFAAARRAWFAARGWCWWPTTRRRCARWPVGCSSGRATRCARRATGARRWPCSRRGRTRSWPCCWT